MAFVHGKRTRVFFGAYDLSAFFNSANVVGKAAADETTTFTNDDKTFISGVLEGTASLTGLFDGALLAVEVEVEAAVVAETDNVTTIARGGLALGNRVSLLNADIIDWEVIAPVAGVVSTKLDLEADGGVRGGILLAAGAAVTATGFQASVDNTAGTVNGGVGHLHLTANAQTGASVFKIQHSVDGTTWVDLITFTSVPTITITAERIVVAAGTTVSRYLRAQYTLAGAGSVTTTIAFARG